MLGTLTESGIFRFLCVFSRIVTPQNTHWHIVYMFALECGVLGDESESVILIEIRYSKVKNEFDFLKLNAAGSITTAVTSHILGYLVTIYSIDRLGRGWIQIQSFSIMVAPFQFC